MPICEIPTHTALERMDTCWFVLLSSATVADVLLVTFSLVKSKDVLFYSFVLRDATIPKAKILKMHSLLLTVVTVQL